jgi:hypothetical protein
MLSYLPSLTTLDITGGRRQRRPICVIYRHSDPGFRQLKQLLDHNTRAIQYEATATVHMHVFADLKIYHKRYALC